MNSAKNFARAIAPVALIAVAAPAAAQEADLAKVQAHLSAVDSMTANFTQTDARGRSNGGTLQMQRPGKVRFQYGGGDPLLVADGKRLWFLDYTVGQKSSWGLNQTPLGLLLSGNPDVKRIGKILPSSDPRVVTVRASRAPYGTLILVFTRSGPAPGGLSLYGWTAIDAQNRKTTVKLSNVRYNVAVPASAFTFREPKRR
jgi:chaperone LolA